MQTETNPTGITTDVPTAAAEQPAVSGNIAATAPGQLRVIKRNGTVVPFEASKISVAITKAFLAVEGGTAAASSRRAKAGSPAAKWRPRSERNATQLLSGDQPGE